jgi:pimeloyl-ACP methyl ester carboxylesterase
METKFFERPEGTLAYDDSGGDGELVLMLPGMGALRSEYRYLAPKISEAGYRAVTADLRGHGESSAGWPTYDIPAVGRDILALTDHLSAGPAHLIGTSLSPGAIVWAAAEKPEAIRSMTLIGAFVRTPKTTLIERLLMPVMMNGPWKVSAWITFYRTMYPTRKPDDFETYLNQLRSNLKEPGRFAANKAFAAASKQPSEERLRKTKAPALVVMGSKDPDFPQPEAEARYIGEQVGGKVVMIDGAGHYPQTEMPDKVAPIILEFLERSVREI